MVIYSKSGGNRENSSSVRQKRRSQTEYYSPVGTAAKGTKRNSWETKQEVIRIKDVEVHHVLVCCLFWVVSLLSIWLL